MPKSIDISISSSQKHKLKKKAKAKKTFLKSMKSKSFFKPKTNFFTYEECDTSDEDDDGNYSDIQ